MRYRITSNNQIIAQNLPIGEAINKLEAFHDYESCLMKNRDVSCIISNNSTPDLCYFVVDDGTRIGKIYSIEIDHSVVACDFYKFRLFNFSRN